MLLAAPSRGRGRAILLIDDALMHLAEMERWWGFLGVRSGGYFDRQKTIVVTAIPLIPAWQFNPAAGRYVTRICSMYPAAEPLVKRDVSAFVPCTLYPIS